MIKFCPRFVFQEPLGPRGCLISGAEETEWPGLAVALAPKQKPWTCQLRQRPDSLASFPRATDTTLAPWTCHCAPQVRLHCPLLWAPIVPGDPTPPRAASASLPCDCLSTDLRVLGVVGAGTAGWQPRVSHGVQDALLRPTGPSCHSQCVPMSGQFLGQVVSPPCDPGLGAGPGGRSALHLFGAVLVSVCRPMPGVLADDPFCQHKGLFLLLFKAFGSAFPPVRWVPSVFLATFSFTYTNGKSRLTIEYWFGETGSSHVSSLGHGPRSTGVLEFTPYCPKSLVWHRQRSRAECNAGPGAL